MQRRFLLSCSCGNDSIAMIQHSLNAGFKFVNVAYIDTGWASKTWYERVDRVEEFVVNNGYIFSRLKGEFSFSQLMIYKQGFPMPGKTWCSLHLKAIPFLTWADEIDPEKRAIVMLGKRRDESHARASTRPFVYCSEFHGGRDLLHPLAYITKEIRDKLVLQAGFKVLSHRSKECSPCVNANRTDLQQLDVFDIKKVKRLEDIIGKTLFRPKHHMGATGIDQVIKWANSARGKFNSSETTSGCSSYYCDKE